MSKLIDARHLFPHAVLPLGICDNCGGRLTKMPDNVNIAQIACSCGAIGAFRKPIE